MIDGWFFASFSSRKKTNFILLFFLHLILAVEINTDDRLSDQHSDNNIDDVDFGPTPPCHQGNHVHLEPTCSSSPRLGVVPSSSRETTASSRLKIQHNDCNQQHTVRFKKPLGQ